MGIAPLAESAASRTGDRSPPNDAPRGLPAISPGAVGRVELRGRLGQRYQGNVDYLLHVHREHGRFMLDAFRLRERRNKERPWDGEYAGKWLDAAACVAAHTGHEELRAKALAMAAAMRDCQDEDGYIGVEGPRTKGKTSWDVWNQWYAITGWLTCYERLGDRLSLEAATRTARWLAGHYGPIDGAGHRFFRAAHGGGCNVDVCDQLVRVYGHTKNRELLDFVRGARKYYRPIQAMRRSGEPHLMHPYVLLALLGGMADLAVAEDDPRELGWLESVWEGLSRDHIYPTGSLGLGEKLTPAGPSDRPDASHQETCATVEWLLFNRRMYAATGRTRYVEAMERSIDNALLAAQSPDGMAWTYYTPLRYEKRWFAGPTRCCYWSGPRAVAWLSEWVYAVDREGLRIDLYEPGEARLTARGAAVRLVQRGDLIADGRVTIEIGPQEPVEMTFKVRVPGWARRPSLAVNGQKTNDPLKPGTHHPIRRVWTAGDRIELFAEVPCVVERMGEHGAVVLRGPEVLAIDARDNPRLDLDEVSLTGEVILKAAAADGSRRRYAASLFVDGEKTEVLVTPYAEAGVGARFRTVFPIRPVRPVP